MFFFFFQVWKKELLKTKYISKNDVNPKAVSYEFIIGVLYFLTREMRRRHRGSKKIYILLFKIWVIFKTLSSISPTNIVFCLQNSVWLESFDCHISFATSISGSLIVTTVLWLLSSGNILSVSHSDTTLYYNL